MQDLECSEEIERNDNNKVNDSSKDDLSEHVSSQESHYSIKSVVAASRSSSGRCEKGAREKARRGDLGRALVHKRHNLGV